ncbi:MAG: RNA polymerase sigma factor [Pseudomonadota bacterium]
MNRVRAEVEAGLEERLTRLWRFGLSLCGDRATADDLVQATCIRALEKAAQYRTGSSLDAWLYTIMRSIWKNMLRANSVRRGNGVVDVGTTELEAAGCDGDTRMELIQTLKRIDALPEIQRGVMLLVGVEGLSYADAARILEVPVGTIMSRLSAARKSLALAKRAPNANALMEPPHSRSLDQSASTASSVKWSDGDDFRQEARRA